MAAVNSNVGTTDSEKVDGYSWSVAASKYESTVGRMTDIAGHKAIDMANSLRAITAESSVLDVGAGTGAVSLAAATRFPSTKVLATDFSGEMLANLKERGGHLSNLKTEVADANKLSSQYDSGTFSNIFCNFALQTATTNPMSVLRQMSNILTLDGVVCIGIWGPIVDPFVIWEKACRTIDPEYVMPAPFEDARAWRTELELSNALTEAGFSAVQVMQVRLPSPYESASAFEDFWFGAKNPGAQSVIDAWKGDLSLVKQAVRDVVERFYDNGRAICLDAVLGVGRKT